MLETLISSKTRIKLLLKLFLNSNNKGYLRGMEDEFGDNSNAVRLELNRLEKAGMLTSEMEGNKKMFKANKDHPLFLEIHKILLKHTGIETIINRVITQIGDVEKVYLKGKLATGLDSNLLEIEFIGHPNIQYLSELTLRAEGMIGKKISYSVIENEVASAIGQKLLIWEKG